MRSTPIAVGRGGEVMAINLEAVITVPGGSLRVGDAMWIELTIRNQTDSDVSVVNPDVGTPQPEINWKFSHETYQTSVLLFFHLMSISMTNASGEELPRDSPSPWVTPILMPRLRFAPGDFFKLRINLSDHYQLPQSGNYHLRVEYGDESASGIAEKDLLIE
jgi:hypothetical protein